MKRQALISIAFLSMFVAGCGGEIKPQQPATSALQLAHSSAQRAQVQLGPAVTNEALSKAAIGQGRMGRQSALGVSGALAIDPTDREAARLFFNRVYLQTGVSMGWTGNYEAGNAGAVTPDYHAATMERINWYRAMAGLPAATVFSPENSVGAQQAALMMSVNGQLSHFPPTTWKHYTAAGAQAAGRSNLALGVNGPDAIDAYINDYGDNNGPVGHRRWILHPNSRSFGIGDVPRGTMDGAEVWGANALHVFDVDATRPRVARDGFVAWPTRGYVPYTVVYGRWSLSQTNADFSRATVSVSRDGEALDVKLEPVVDGYAENTIVWQLPAMSMVGARHAAPAKDIRYHVTVSNVFVAGQARSFDYDVTVFDPAVPTAGAALPQVSVPASVTRGSTYTAHIDPMPGTTGYGLLVYQNRPATHIAAADFTPATWTAGSGTSPDAIGNGELRLYHDGGGIGAPQTLQLNKKLMVGRDPASISFVRSAGFVMESQAFRVQVSTDDAATWTDIYSEPGAGTVKIPANRVSASLHRFAGRAVRLRFVSDHGSQRYIGAGTGWNVKDIAFQGVGELINEQDLRSPNGTFSFTAAQPGGFVFLPRVQYQGRYFSDSGPAGHLTVEGALLHGPLASYNITRSNELVTIADRVGQDGVQTVRNPFRIDFTDLTLAFDMEGNAGKAYRLYRAAFDRKPDSAGLGFWIAALDGGAPIEMMAEGFIKSVEFANLIGTSPTNAHILTAVYRNVLHRAPDEAGFAYWLNQMDNGVSVQRLLIDFSESAENKQQVASEVALGIPYTRWSP